MFRAEAFNSIASNISIFFPQKCNDTRTQLYQGLLREHKKLKTEDKKLRTGIKEQFNKLVQQVKDLEGKFFLRPSRLSSEPFSYPNHLLCFTAEKEQRTQQHAADLQKKEEEIAELKNALGEADKELQSLKGAYRKTKKSLECTAEHLTELQAEAKEWKKFLVNMDTELSSEFGFILRNCTLCFLRHFDLLLLRGSRYKCPAFRNLTNYYI